MHIRSRGSKDVIRTHASFLGTVFTVVLHFSDTVTSLPRAPGLQVASQLRQKSENVSFIQESSSINFRMWTHWTRSLWHGLCVIPELTANWPNLFYPWSWCCCDLSHMSGISEKELVPKRRADYTCTYTYTHTGMLGTPTCRFLYYKTPHCLIPPLRLIYNKAIPSPMLSERWLIDRSMCLLFGRPR